MSIERLRLIEPKVTWHFTEKGEGPKLALRRNLFYERGRARQERHGYTHLSSVTWGRVEVWVEGQSLGVLSAPAVLEIEAHKEHFFDVLEAGTIIDCMHVVGDDGEILVEKP